MKKLKLIIQQLLKLLAQFQNVAKKKLIMQFLVVLFFGYARQGILIAPSVAILIALTLDGFWSKTLARLSIVVLCMIPALEVYRYIDKPTLTQDGSEIQGRDPSANGYQDRRIEVR